MKKNKTAEEELKNKKEKSIDLSNVIKILE